MIDNRKPNEIEYERYKREIQLLQEHICTYSIGSLPAFYMQLHSSIGIETLLNMKLSGISYVDGNIVKIRKKVLNSELGIEDRKILAWYLMQRIPVSEVAKSISVLEEDLCINKKGGKLENQVYQKMLNRYSKELGLSRIYTSFFLRGLYGYFNIIEGKKTVDMLAKEYNVKKYYLLHTILKDFEIKPDPELINQIADVD